MGKDIDRGLCGRDEKHRYNESSKSSKTEKVKEKTREELGKNFKRK